uniref:NADH-ubiquinone oxidoreductase chain 1 n=1 Tax=Dermanyssus gallinae TaxID=34641 RepID=A0A7U3PYB0_9ACAR|nr:NADH dehydrogenase subunit 1 [Dermanyssus gallinae]QPG86051.1 NADH dehydrogenase subunit 1 [Dermanyssus gallinae]
MSLIFVKLYYCLFILISVAFITLLERKILGYIQIRKGPNKILFSGLMQPIADAIKLLMKEMVLYKMLNKLMFMIFPLFSLMLLLLYFMIIMYKYNGGMELEFSMIMIMIISSMGVYIVMGCGWSSNSKYSLLGSYRGVAQTISYEVVFSFMIVMLFLPSMGLNFKKMMLIQNYSYSYLLTMSLFFLVWGVVLLAELNRIPFDFVEGESELVSGYNVEYGGILFAILFMAEYGNIIFMSFLTSIIFKGGSMYFTMVLIFLVLLLRGGLPRFRYDLMMIMIWKGLLPMILLFCLFIFLLQ